MSRIVVDTGVTSYIFNWHSSAQSYVDALRGSELMRMGALPAGWGVRRSALLERFITGFGVVYADDALGTSWATLGANAPGGRPITEPLGRMDRGDRVGSRRSAGHDNLRDFEHMQKFRLFSP